MTLKTKNQKSKSKNQSGFTVLEMIVAMFAFSIILTLIGSAFVHVLVSQRRAINAQKVEENLTYIMEAMTREIRVAQPTPGTALTFFYTGASQTYVVPVGMTEVTITALGGQGDRSNGPAGGLGGQAVATIAVTPGEILQINVGGAAIGMTGGFNGGGTGGNSSSGVVGGGGGGASDVRRFPNALTNRLIVAGGGAGSGGGGNNLGGVAGVGGGSSGTIGGNGCSGGAVGGGGGTQVAGGAAGAGLAAGSAGGTGPGGAGGNSTNNTGGGGGGGGGYRGGGGGGGSNAFCGAGGGGGSSFLTGTGTDTQSGINSGNGSVIIGSSTGTFDTLGESCTAGSPGFATTLNFYNSTGQRIVYSLSDTTLYRSVDGLNEPVSSNNVQFTKLQFCIKNITAYGKQPRITITASVQSVETVQQIKEDYQTTVSVRFLKI